MTNSMPLLKIALIQNQLYPMYVQVPSWVTKRWLHTLSREYPTLAFHASITNPFGKGSLLGLLRQLARLRSDKQYISVGLVGYPNVGKSSVINTLRSKKVCSVAPIPGETKVWQYITLMKRIFLIDCPGVVYSGTGDSDTDTVLKGVVRVESLDDATEHIDAVLERVKPEYLKRAYRIVQWENAQDFLEQVARGTGKLGKGGEPDLNTAAKMVLHDWQRGKIPFFTLPPDYEPEEGGGSKASIGSEQVPAEAVTEVDAEGGPDGAPERAAAAAKAFATEAATALKKQRRGAIPVQAGLYSEDEDGLEEEEDDSDENAAKEEGEDEEEGSEEEEDPEDPEEEEGEGSEDGDDSDGEEGEGGLSWDDVVRKIRHGMVNNTNV